MELTTNNKQEDMRILIRKTQVEMTEPNNLLGYMKNLQKNLNSRATEGRERISELKDEKNKLADKAKYERKASK